MRGFPLRAVRTGGLLASGLLIAACSRTPVLAPVGQDPRVNDLTGVETPRPAHHVVHRGETLYSIAFRYGLNFRDVADWNGVSEPYVIYPGERLRLTPGAPSVAARSKPSSQAKQIASAPEVSKPKQKPETNSATPKPSSANAPRSVDADIDFGRWAWPAEGRLSTTFAQSGSKGIDIEGKIGEPVLAAADGKVVYSGGGLIGYGELIIIKHNKHYLSAYGHNAELLVKQGDYVVAGQRIASMGHSGTDGVKLHFEIRRDGKPVDPVRYLPK